jgi:two-component system alkaline phosphatase synthesis response regulator PhoP
MKKILIAEDERDIRDLVSFTLQFAGYQVVAAADGQEAVELAIREQPDMILMDVRMPRLSGYEACKRIKAEPSLVDVPVVFLSAKGQDSEIRLGLEAGAQEYVVKPFAPAELVEKVKSLLAKYG